VQYNEKVHNTYTQIMKNTGSIKLFMLLLQKTTINERIFMEVGIGMREGKVIALNM